MYVNHAKKLAPIQIGHLRNRNNKRVAESDSAANISVSGSMFVTAETIAVCLIVL